MLEVHSEPLPQPKTSQSSTSTSVSADRAGSKGRPDESERVLTWAAEQQWFQKRNGDTLRGALAFVPWVLWQAFKEGNLHNEKIVIHRGTGAMVMVSEGQAFADLMERLAAKDNGAEQLSQCLASFFTPLIDLITNYRGDVIKFSGASDTLLVYFPAVDDTKHPKYRSAVPPHGTYGLPDLGPMATAVLRAAACCLEIHKRLHNFDTGVDDVRFCQHIGVGCGNVRILQVGGVVPPNRGDMGAAGQRAPQHAQRSEYLIAGPPLEQISAATPLAKDGETCVSPQAWEHLCGCVVEGPPIKDNPGFHLLQSMDESKYTFPTIKHAAMDFDDRVDAQFGLAELHLIRRFVPSAVFKQLEGGTLAYVNELRRVSTIFVSGSGLDVMTDKGARDAQQLVRSVQQCCYQHEGTLCKFLIDDKGMLFLLAFGLPPLVHTDDPTRAVLACFDMADAFRQFGIVGRFGVTTGRNYCGVCGSAQRMEYTTLGVCVNLSARLMANAPPLGILCDEETKSRCSTEVIFKALPPLKGEGKASRIPTFQPMMKGAALDLGLTPEKRIHFPWYDHPFGGGLNGVDGSTGAETNVQLLCSVKTWDGIVQVEEMLGGSFSKALHNNDQTIELTTPKVTAPSGSPFLEGGVVALNGPTGTGKIELAEHMVTHAAVRFHMMPVFGKMGPRPGDSINLAAKLLRSTLSVFRFLDEGIPAGSYAETLEKVLPAKGRGKLQLMKRALDDAPAKERASDMLDAALEGIELMLPELRKQVPVMLVLQFEHGTSLFPKMLEDQSIFWTVVSRLSKKLVTRGAGTGGEAAGGCKPLVLLILCQDADTENAAVQSAKEGSAFLNLSGLTEENILEYMSKYLCVPESLIPPPLTHFVSKVTSGNPLYIRETIDQLQEHNIQLEVDAKKVPKRLDCKDLDKVDLSSWSHTQMVGSTVCLLESLDPLEAAVLKMSICFTGTFTLPDLAASTCSRWANATHFDFLRLFRALRKLVNERFIEAVDAPRSQEADDGGGQSPRGVPVGTTQHYMTRNLLIRSVGGGMVLESQKKSVKRQALIERALRRELPHRMYALASRREGCHVPWYYEHAFRRMSERALSHRE